MKKISVISIAAVLTAVLTACGEPKVHTYTTDDLPGEKEKTFEVTGLDEYISEKFDTSEIDKAMEDCLNERSAL